MLSGQWPNSQEKTQNLNGLVIVSQVLSIWKLALLSLPFSKIPNPQKRYIVFTDAGDQAAAAILVQEYKDDDSDMKEISIAYLSAKCSDTQLKWSTVVKEGYTIYYAIKKWRH